MLKSHSIALALLSAALFPATISFAQDQTNLCFTEDVGPAFEKDGSDLFDLRNKGSDFHTNPVLNKHVSIALRISKAADKEAGFGFYSSDDCKYVPGKIRINQSSSIGSYDHIDHYVTEDKNELAFKYSNTASNWKFVGDAHVHAGNAATPGTKASNNIGSPSLQDLKDFINPKNKTFHMGMTIASVKGLNGFDASIVFREGDFRKRSPNFGTVVKEASRNYKPNSHKSAMRFIKDAYAGSNIAYFSGGFKGSPNALKGGSFKYRGNP